MELIIATKNDWKILLEWRNDALTRENSINSEMISEADHKKWFFSSLKNPNRKIYLVKDNDVFVGTVRADIDSEKTTISWSVAPVHRGKGYAKRMVKLLVDSIGGSIVAIIKRNNIASIKVAEYAGLKFFKKIDDIYLLYRK